MNVVQAGPSDALKSYRYLRIGIIGPGKMSDAHKEALALGREQSRHVANYLNALEAR